LHQEPRGLNAALARQCEAPRQAEFRQRKTPASRERRRITAKTPNSLDNEILDLGQRAIAIFKNLNFASFNVHLKQVHRFVLEKSAQAA